MWAKGRFGDIRGVVARVKEFGFTCVELNSSFPPETLDGLLETSIPISSMHSPCPGYLSSRASPASGLSLSSADEIERMEAIAFARKTIDLASRVGAQAIVLHMGEVPEAFSLGDELYRLNREGDANSKEYSCSVRRLVSRRSSMAAPYLEAARKSLRELSEYSEVGGVALGLETRFHFHEIPRVDEMEWLLDGTDERVVGYWHDVGHAEVQQRLGVASHEEWLRRFRGRMLGIHLHDVVGLRDHYVPGEGDLDWGLIKKYLPEEAIKTCEIGEWNEAEHVGQTIPFLRKKGILV